jgi:ubiquinone/menaquinone biosynthesis C-methylase UbiE
VDCTVLVQQHSEKIYQHYNSSAIALGYGQQEYITPCERLLFDTYIKPGMAILDMGVGGGRTSPYLAETASRYVGIDYSPEMLQICREKYPKWEYFECSATDLSPFQSGSFDVVVISFNMLDDLFPNENRWRCLQECQRVLRENGLLIFSSQNPRAILVRPRKADGTKNNRQSSYIFTLFRKVLDLSAKFLKAVRSSARDAFSRGTKSPFWRGEGYMLDNVLDEKLMTHFWTPKKAIAELVRYGFRFVALQGDDYPLRSHMLITHWYYYVFQKAPQSSTADPGAAKMR